jgi:predicted RNA methylase
MPVSKEPVDLPEEFLLGQFIPLHYHFNMLRDQSRTIPFRSAIELLVPEGGVVVELGGGTGILSWFAAQKADRVYCVERNPALFHAARSFLADNPQGDRVHMVLADAMDWIPPEPVNVVICEMLHVAMVREKQLAVIQAFKDRYKQRFQQLPQFIPDTTVLAIQAVHQDYHFCGYRAAVPVFDAPGTHLKDQWLSDLHFYSTIEYGLEFATSFDVDAEMVMTANGHLNAISFLTNNILAFQLREGTACQWLMNRMTLPLENTLTVTQGDRVKVKFQYEAGCPIEHVQASLSAHHCAEAPPAFQDRLLRRSA